MDEPKGVGAVVRYRYAGRKSWPEDPTIGRVEYAVKTFEDWEVSTVSNTYRWDNLPAQPGTLKILSAGIDIEEMIT